MILSELIISSEYLSPLTSFTQANKQAEMILNKLKHVKFIFYNAKVS